MSFIVFGWGKNSKELGYIGIRRCPVCNSFAHFRVHEVANNIRLYFIPVAKFNKKRFLVCGRCGNGLELDEESFKTIMKDYAKALSPEKTGEMWNEIAEAIQKSENDEAIFNGYLAEITQKYGESDFVYEHVHRLVDYHFDKVES